MAVFRDSQVFQLYCAIVLCALTAALSDASAGNNAFEWPEGNELLKHARPDGDVAFKYIMGLDDEGPKYWNLRAAAPDSEDGDFGDNLVTSVVGASNIVSMRATIFSFFCSRKSLICRVACIPGRGATWSSSTTMESSGASL